MDPIPVVEAVSASVGAAAAVCAWMGQAWRRHVAREQAEFQHAVEDIVNKAAAVLAARQIAAEYRLGRRLDAHEQAIALLRDELGRLQRRRR